MKKRQQVLAFLVVLAVITFLDRISLSVAAARMQGDLHIDTARWGWILGAFVLSYALFEIPTGQLGDRLGPRRILTRVVLWWTAFTALTGFARGFYSLLATRFLFGVGEAGAYPNISAALARWFPATSRAKAQGMIWGASRLGGALAPLIVVPLQRTLGWRTTFVLLGVVGAAWAGCWFLWYRDRPDEQPGITAAELAEIPPAFSLAQHAKTNWKQLLRSRQMGILVAMYFFYAWGPWFYFSWYPLYLMKTGHFSEKQMGVFSALPYILGMAANLIGGPVFDRLAARRGIRFAGRLIGTASLLGAAALMLAMVQIHQQAPLVIVSAMALGVNDFMVPAVWAVAMHMGGEWAGTVTGAMNSAGNIGGFVCSVAAGYLVQATGSYNAPVIMVASVLIIAAALFTGLDGSAQIFQKQDSVADSLAEGASSGVM
jgi:ACS family glucarate transporter-like MFS transporter